jgi:hypothetical protein
MALRSFALKNKPDPRDLFDVKLLLDHEGTLTEDIKRGVMAGLVSHGRPMAELLQPRMKDKEQSFKSQFEGMTSVPFSYDDHRSTFDRLKTAVLTALDDADRAFLLSFEAAEPDWSLFAFESLQTLFGPQWKLRNLRLLRETAPERHAEGLEALKAALLAGLIQSSPEI